ncbi:MAG: DUF4339 domain-containing protein [Sedimentisphaerales bacterium]|nr:DUF4339 domain-containing protein [Sedimentisphaerales bacterium]
MGLVIALICGVITALLAHHKGRNAIGWFFCGFFLGIIGLIICLVVSNKKDERMKEEQLIHEQRRLTEQLRQERIKNEQFRKHAQIRMDAHDQVLQMDTKNTSQPLLGTGLESTQLVNGQGKEIPDIPPEYYGPPNQDGDYQSHQTNRQGAPPPWPPVPEEPMQPDDSLKESGWYYQLNGQLLGPYSLITMREYAHEGTIDGQTYIWHEYLQDWTPADQVKDIQWGDNA